MKRKIRQFLTITSLGLILPCAAMSTSAQNSNSATGEMKTSGSEIKRAGTTAGHDMKHGRVVRAGKHFSRHTGRSARHFGSGTKKATKKAVKHVVS